MTLTGCLPGASSPHVTDRSIVILDGGHRHFLGKESFLLLEISFVISSHVNGARKAQQVIAEGFYLSLNFQCDRCN